MANNGIYSNGNSEQACDLALEGNSVYLYLQDDKKELLIWHLKSVTAMWLGYELKLTKTKDPQQSLRCSGPLAKQIYDAWQYPVPENRPRREIPLLVYAFVAIVIALILTSCVLIYVYVFPWLVEKSVALIPANVEIQLGDNLAGTYEHEYAVNDSASYYANAFDKQLQVYSNYPLRIEVLRSPELNAFALPGGRIFIYSGMLEKMNSPEELGALLGHEITHVLHQHSLKSIFRNAAAGTAIAAVFGNSSRLTPWILSRADDFKQLDYSRTLETEADANGVEIMVQSKINPKGMLDLLRLLKAENKEEPAMMKYLSTHPGTDERIAAVTANPQLKNHFPENPQLAKLFKQLKASL